MKAKFNKIFAIFITAVLIVALNLPVKAVENETRNTMVFEFDIVNMALTVRGNLDLERAGNNLILRFIDSDGETKFVLQEKSTFSQDEKNVEYKFDILLPENLESGHYKIKVSCNEIDKALELSFSFNGYDRILKALKKVDEARSTKSVGTVITSEIDGVMAAEILGIDTRTDIFPYSIDDYTGLNDNGKRSFEEIMDNYQYILPENPETDEDKGKILDALDAFLMEYRDAVACGKFADIKDSLTFEQWYNAYYELYEFNTTAKEIPDVGITDIVKATKGEVDFVKRISDKVVPMSIDEIKNFIYESAALAYVKTKTSAEVQRILLKYDDDGMIFDGFDSVKFTKLSLTKQEKVIDSFAHIHYSTKDDAVKAINDLMNPQKPNNDKNSGNNGGGNRNPVASFPSVIPSTPEGENTASKNAFKDIDNVKWASDAIEYLAERGIVNGKAEGIFAPDDNITRAEFVKMIILALGVSESGNETMFTDVTMDAWYAPYVIGAYDNGLVLGDSNRCFHPEENITREDIAVILFRAINQNYDGEVTIVFNDAADISDYAKKAVSYLTDKEIVNGFADGTFGPNKNATRAESAVMLYRLINKK